MKNQVDFGTVICGLAELFHDVLVEGHGGLDDVGAEGLDFIGEAAGEVAREEGVVDDVEGGPGRHSNGEGDEPSLEAGVDFERAGSGIHAGDDLGVGNVDEGILS